MVSKLETGQQVLQKMLTDGLHYVGFSPLQALFFPLSALFLMVSVLQNSHYQDLQEQFGITCS